MATVEQMTVHKALAELKVLDARINKAIHGPIFVTTKKENQSKVACMTPDEFDRTVKSAYDSVNSLIARRNAIKDAVNESNAITMVTVGGENMSVVKAIDKKNNGMTCLIELRDYLTKQLASAKVAIEKHNGSLQESAEKFVTNLLGGKDVKGNEDYNALVNSYIKSNTMTMIDPIGIEKEIQRLDDEISAFMPEVDAALSTSNALTVIEISY